MNTTDFDRQNASETMAPTDDVTDLGTADLRPPVAEALTEDPRSPDAGPTSRETGAPPAPTGPRVRWAGIVWGFVLAALAGTALWVLVDGERRDAVAAWFTSLTPAAAIAYVVLVVGALALVAGLVGIARRAQRAIERRREASLAAPAEEITPLEDAQAPSRLP